MNSFHRQKVKNIRDTDWDFPTKFLKHYIKRWNNRIWTFGEFPLFILYTKVQLRWEIWNYTYLKEFLWQKETPTLIMTIGIYRFHFTLSHLTLLLVVTNCAMIRWTIKLTAVGKGDLRTSLTYNKCVTRSWSWLYGRFFLFSDDALSMLWKRPETNAF